MDVNEFYYLLKEQALENENYKQWRVIHGRAFGDVFLCAFEENDEAQIHLTAALIKISQRRFNEAMPQLELLKNFCFNDFDTAALNYFTALNYEFLGNEVKMTEYYEKWQECDVDFSFNTAFHPYYRTAKLAQKSGEYKKAVFYYHKALELLDGAEIDDKKAKALAQIKQDIMNVNEMMRFSE